MITSAGGVSGGCDSATSLKPCLTGVRYVLFPFPELEPLCRNVDLIRKSGEKEVVLSCIDTR